MIDRLTIMSKTYCDFPMECKQCIQNVRDVFRQNCFEEQDDIQIPQNQKDFLRWIPNQFNLFTSLINEIQKKLSMSDNKLTEFVQCNPIGKNKINKKREN